MEATDVITTYHVFIDFPNKVKKTVWFINILKLLKLLMQISSKSSLI